MFNDDPSTTPTFADDSTNNDTPVSRARIDYMVRKRDGVTLVPYDTKKIKNAIVAAFEASKEIPEDLVERTSSLLVLYVDNALRMTYPINKYISEGFIYDVEEIQNVVENVLMSKGHLKTAKKYIIYREKRTAMREFSGDNVTGIIDEYLGLENWEIKENSNIGFSLQGLNNFVTSKIMSKYWLEKILTPDAKDAHLKGEIHVHDLNLLSPYCCGWDLRDLLLRGFGGVQDTTASLPAKHFDTALGHVWNFLYTLQGEAAGAQAFSNFDTYLAPFIAYDNLSYKEVKQHMQKFFHNMTTKTRVGFQTPFTNVSIDLYVPKHLKDEAVIIGGQFMDRTYGEFQNEMDMFNRAFCETLLEGDANGRQFPFPIPNYSITKDFDWDNPNLEVLWKLTSKYGTPYFTNFVNSSLNPEDIRSMCPFHPEEKITAKFGDNWMTFTMYGLFSILNRRDTEGVFVRLNGKEIPLKNVICVPTESYIEVITLKTPNGITFERNHLQPTRSISRLEDGMELGPIRTEKVCNLKVGDYIPYSMTGVDPEKIMRNCFIADGFLWAPILKKCEIGKTHPYSYCIEVDSDDHLFELREGGLVTHNCRLQLDNRVLRKRGGGLFGAAPLTGSIGVVTLNLPNIAFTCEGSEEKFFAELGRRADMAAQLLQDKRKFVEILADRGLYPFSSVYMDSIKQQFGEYFYMHFSTIGIVGGNEACLNFLGVPNTHPEGIRFQKKIQEFLNGKCLEYQMETGYPFNLEATPAEGVSYRLARLDSQNHPGIITASSHIKDAEPFYTNSTQVPVDYSTNIVEVCEHQDNFQTGYTGGTVLHVFLGEEIKDPSVTKKLVRTLCQNYHAPYITLSPKYSVCKSHGYLSGEVHECPSCGDTTEVYARVVGFYTPVSRWNKGKQQESTQRNSYDGFSEVIDMK